MKRVIPIVCFLFFSGVGLCQIPGVSLSEDHVRLIEEAKNPALKLKLYRRFFKKDSIKTVKAFEARLKHRSDSLSQSWQTVADLPQKKLNQITGALNSRLRLPGKISNPLASKGKQLTDASSQAGALSKNIESASKSLSQSVSNLSSKAGLDSLNLRGTITDSLSNLNLKLPDSLGGLAKNFKLPQLGIPKLDPGVTNLVNKVGADSLSLPGNTAGGLGNQKMQLPNLAIGGMDQNLKLPSGRIDNINMHQVKNIENQAGTYKKELGQYTGQYGKYLQSDSLKSLPKNEVAVLEKRAESQAMTYVGGAELQKFRKELDLMKSQQAQYANLGDSAAMKQKAKEESEKMAMKYLEDHPELLNGVQKKISLLMKKYSYVGNSNDLSTAIKRTSLKGKTFRERMVLGLNFQILSLGPVTLDFLPVLGYKFNTRFALGLGGTYRQTFGGHSGLPPSLVFGYKSFISYEVLKSFFAYGEFARNSPGVKVEDGHTVRIWKNAMMLGIGRKMAITPKVDMTLVVAYNFFHQNPDPVYPRPLIVRVGFQFSELAMLKKKLEMPKY